VSTAKQPPGGLIGYMLDDEDRTRRARTLLWPVAVMVLSLAVLVAQSPVAGGAVAGTAGVITWCRALLQRRRM
jgi:hypothetical protein